MQTFFKIKLSVLALILSGSLAAQDAHKHLLRGDRQYEDGNFPEAELDYRRALDSKGSVQGNFNLGNATYRQERYEEAANHFQAAAESAPDAATKSLAFHNLGNAYYQSGKFKESVEAYKSALRLNPQDEATRQNLSMALRRLPPKQPESQDSQQQNQEKNDDQEKKDEQQQQDQQQKDEQQQDEPSEGDQSSEQSQKQKQEQAQDMSKQEAAKLLEIMDQEEQRVQEKQRKAQVRSKRQAKDW